MLLAQPQRQRALPAQQAAERQAENHQRYQRFDQAKSFMAPRHGASHSPPASGQKSLHPLARARSSPPLRVTHCQ